MLTQDTSTLTQFYTWLSYRCAYEVHNPVEIPDFFKKSGISTPLVLIHPIGVGLSRKFWQRFCQEFYKQGHQNQIYNPDIIGCGDSDMPAIPSTPEFEAQQLQFFIQNIIQKPVILVVQGALFPVAIELYEKTPDLIAGMVLSGPPTWSLISKDKPKWRQNLAWSIFSSPFGNLFYRYARTEKFLRNFSTKRLFAFEDKVDPDWLSTLRKGASNMASRYAVFSFLAGFWRQDYRSRVAAIQKPVLVVMGEVASSIAREGEQEKANERLAEYLACLPQAQGIKIPGRNVLPYESTTEFVKAMLSFVKL
jgi:pimeloyl-ACP methyl ester carboxylesterase